MIALPWYFDRNHQGADFNFLYGRAPFFILFWKMYAGTLVDRFSRIGFKLRVGERGLVLAEGRMAVGDLLSVGDGLDKTATTVQVYFYLKT